MKIFVDVIPKNPLDCSFASYHFSKYECRWIASCLLQPGFTFRKECVLEKGEECPYLKESNNSKDNPEVIENSEDYKYDENGNIIYQKFSNGLEAWYEYDENGEDIHYKDSNGFEYWKEYDKQGNLIHIKDSENHEKWYEYDENGKEIHYKNSNGFERWTE